MKLEIKLLGNSKTRRQDCKCFSFEMVVDSDRTNFSDFIESVVEKYPPGYMEVAHVQYYDEALKTFPEIKTDQDLMSMFSKHCKSKYIIMFIVYRGPSDPYEPVTKWDFNVDSQPKNSIELDEDDYLRNPAPQNEHVGIDEEALYFENVPRNALQVVNYPIEAQNRGDESEDDSEDEEEEEDDKEDEDEEVEEEDEVPCNDGNNAPNVDYDIDDPPMVVGSTYSSMAIFRLAISQHAIKNQFEFNIAKSGPQRFRAYCSRKDKDKCQWWLYASTTKGSTTVTVNYKPYFFSAALVLFFYY